MTRATRAALACTIVLAVVALVQPTSQTTFLAGSASRAAAPSRGRAAPEEGSVPQNRRIPPGARTTRAAERAPAAPGAPAAATLAASPSFQGELNDTSDDVIPPDVGGAVGPNDVVGTTNESIRVLSRTDGSLKSSSLLTAFWQSTTSPAPNPFDPHVLYDRASARWIVVSVANPQSSSSGLLIAVSTSGDPTPANAALWHKWFIPVADSNLWYDFPSVGLNHDWIVVTVNAFCNGGGGPCAPPNGKCVTFGLCSYIFPFRKANLYAGTLSYHSPFVDPNGFTQTPIVSYDSAAQGMYLVEDWNGNDTQDTQYCGSSPCGVLRLTTITGPVGSETYTGVPLNASIFVATPGITWGDNFSGITFDGAPQSGDSHTIDTGDGRILGCAYRSGSIWCAQTVFLPASNPTRSSAQWWQLTPTGNVIQRGLIDDPTATNDYAYPSIAVNADDLAVIGYSAFSATTFASARYAMRVASDPVGTTETDALLKAGLATYYKTLGGGSNRWGDFTTTVVDPANDLSLWTAQEYAETHDGSGTSRWGTWFGRVAPTSATTTTGGFSNGAWSQANSNAAGVDLTGFRFGSSGDRAIPGDWDGNGSITPGVVRGNVWYVRNSNVSGVADLSFKFGLSTDYPFAGDWDGNGAWGPGIRRGNTWFLRNETTDGVADVSFSYGSSTDTPLVGYWGVNANHDFTPAVRRGNVWYFKNDNSSGPADFSLAYGSSSDIPFVGDWDGNGTWTPGVYRPSTNQWFLKNSFVGGNADIVFGAPASGTPIVGNWNGGPNP